MEETIYAQALLVEDGIIRQVGSQQELLAQAASDTRLIDLQGHTLMPAFIDAHSHITGYADALGRVDLSGVKCPADMEERVKKYLEYAQLRDNDWIIGQGYDQNSFQNAILPTKDILDAYSDGRPMLLLHASGHSGIMNSRALALSGIHKKTPEPQGGKIGRMPDGEPNGYLEENALINGDLKIPAPDPARQMRLLEQAQQNYLRYGITTVQSGLTRQADWSLLEKASMDNKLLLDVVCYIDQNVSVSLLWDHPLWVKQYYNHLKIGGYKIILDGSPQGRTAWMSAPYENAPDGYRGTSIYTEEEVTRFFEQILQDSMQILVHCNGDAASEQMLSAWERLVNGYNVGLRPVMIHSQFVRRDQLERMARLGVIASFFMVHVYYWGDVHVKNMGIGRAQNISPARDAMDAGTVFTFHQDTPVVEPDMLFTVWSAVNRLDRNGKVLGSGQCVPVIDALRAVTISAAYQYFEEQIKGSIREGKFADFVILEKNPLKVPPMEIKDIHILQTIKQGQTLYER